MLIPKATQAAAKAVRIACFSDFAVLPRTVRAMYGSSLERSHLIIVPCAKLMNAFATSGNYTTLTGTAPEVDRGALGLGHVLIALLVAAVMPETYTCDIRFRHRRNASGNPLNLPLTEPPISAGISV